MKDVNFVDAESLNSLEEYGAALISSIISLKTLEKFHVAAWKKGLLDEDEEECSKTICWEIKRLLVLYQTQVENIMDRTQLDEQSVIANLKALVPGVKVPKKRKKKDNAGSNSD